MATYLIIFLLCSTLQIHRIEKKLIENEFEDNYIKIKSNFFYKFLFSYYSDIHKTLIQLFKSKFNNHKYHYINYIHLRQVNCFLFFGSLSFASSCSIKLRLRF